MIVELHNFGELAKWRILGHDGGIAARQGVCREVGVYPVVLCKVWRTYPRRVMQSIVKNSIFIPCRANELFYFNYYEGLSLKTSILDKCYIVYYNVNMGGIKSRLDFGQLSKEIRELNNRKSLYRLLKEELGKLGHWKQKPRGDPIKAFSMRGKDKQRGAE